MQIEKGIPLPKRIADRVRVGPLPLGELDVGDSILVECPEHEKDRIIHSIRVRLGRFSNRNMGYKFSATKVEEGVRIWRK